MPVAQIPVVGRLWTAVIDTGFNGDLELPLELRPLVKARFRNRVEVLLAAGAIVVQENYTVSFPFDGEEIDAEALFVPGSEILLDTHILRKYRLTMDFVEKWFLLDRRR